MRTRQLIWTGVSVVTLTLVVAIGGALAVGPIGDGSLPPGNWVSGTQVQNVGTGTAVIVLEYHSQDGTTSYSSAVVSVDPGASTTYYLDPNLPDGFLGSAVVSSDEPIRAVTNVVNLSTDARGSYNGFGAGATQVSFALVKRDYWGASTEIYIQNTDAAQVTVTPSYKRGGDTWTGDPVTINPGFMKVFSPADAGVPTGFVGSGVFTATGDIAGAYIEFVGNTASVGTGFPSGTESDKIFIPLVKKFYWGAATGIQVQNVGAAPADFYVIYTSTTGVDYASAVVSGVEVGASHTYYLDPVLPDGFLGAATITSTQPIVAIVNEIQVDGSIATTHSGFNDGLQTTRISVPLVKKFYWGAATGIQVQNVGAAPADFYVTYTSTTGVDYASAVVSGVAVGASRTYYLDPVLPNGFLGAATITSTQPIVAIVNELPSSGDGLSTNAFNLTP